LNHAAWKNFAKARDQFRELTEEISLSLPKLQNILQQFVNSRTGIYTVETPVVYNSTLDDITIKDDIKLILVADNPGRREQASSRYLVGPSGKIAQKFFRDNPALGIDFLKHVIILNKTPIHSPRTIELRQLCRMEESIIPVLEESQRAMAALLLKFHEALDCPIWITGYSEMRKGGIFEVYTDSLKKFADSRLFIYRHFSMNQFTIDLKQQALPGETVSKTLKRIGAAYRKRILLS